MATQPNPLVSARQYLELLRDSDVKYEYWDGEVVAMAGASERHNLISASILGNLWQQLRTGPCKPVGSDQLIRRQGIAKYVFADVVVRCRDARIEAGAVDALNDPVVVFEVLSPSTESMDRKQKFAYYSSFESLKELVLVHQEEKLVEHFHRGSVEEEWRVRHLFGDEDELVMECVGARLRIADIYEAVDW